MNADEVFVIAEAGVNHNGSLDLARQLVKAAREAGADAVKFQTFRAEALVIRGARKAAYQRRTTDAEESQFDMLRRLELDDRAHADLMAYCRQAGITFLSSPFDEFSADLLDHIGVERFKLGSGELTNLPLLGHVAEKGRPIIMSTGMATLGEVETALATFRKHGGTDVTLLHCVTEYPCPAEQVNLRAMLTLRAAFDVPVGYSDHTEGINISIAAAAIGARVIEKHFTLDRRMEGPDHKASLEPGELACMVRAIREVSLALGDGIKRPAPCEVANIAIARKSVVTARAIPAGTIISRGDLTVKRPGYGVAPGDLDKIIGRRAAEDLVPDEVITWKMID
jgi:N,N'-diacetyllegionaminate synthase